MAVLALVAAACALAWRPDSPLVPRHGGNVSGTAPLFLVLLIAAFAVYARRAAADPAHASVAPRRDRPRGRDPARPARGAAAPLDRRLDVLVVRLDRVARRREPVRRSAGGLPRQPRAPLHGQRLGRHDDRLRAGVHAASEPLAVVAGDSDAVAAWTYKALAAAAALAAALLAGRLARRRAFAIALVGWNPVLAVHLAGGGHNDAWVGALILAALALSASRRGNGRRRPLGRSRSRSSGCRSSSSRSARSSRGRRGRPRGARGLVGRGRGRRARRHRALRRRLAARDLPARRERGPRDELRDPAPARAARAAGRPRARARARRRCVVRARAARARGRAGAGAARRSPPASCS